MNLEELKRKRAQAKEASGDSTMFIKLKGGESVTGVFRGDPITFYKKFKDNTKYPTWAEGRSFKFQINFVTKEEGKYVAKILEQGVTLCDAMIESLDHYGKESVFTIRRTGTTKDDTRYSVLFEAKLSDEQQKLINDVKLINLGDPYSNDSTEPASQESKPVEVDDDVPF